MDRVTACDYKKLFDTQFEADRAAAIASVKFKTEMVSYQCDKHYHLANANPTLRNRHVGKPRIDWCGSCNVYVNPKNYDKHILKARHLKMLKPTGPGKGEHQSSDDDGNN